MQIPFAIGDTFEREFDLSQRVYDGFIDIFNDRNPLHTDRAFATAFGFDNVVAHGNILNGFLSFLIGEAMPTKDVIIHSQTINYKLPAYIGDRVCIKAVVSEIYESVGAVVLNLKFMRQSRPERERERERERETGSDAAAPNGKPEIIASGKIQIGILGAK
ncbi:hypothetical protein FACS1894103_4620 [Campylobacterota bacterium]|nr:hypothetical protein FACS1894103_4620 [Campylobacterota bacterium]